MGADTNRDGKGPFGRECALGKFSQVVGCHDVDTGDVSPLEHQAVHPGIYPVLWVLGNHDGSRDHGPTVQGRKDRHGEPIEVHLIFFQHYLFYRTISNQLGLDGLLHGPLEFFLDLHVWDLDCEREAVPRLEEAGDHRDRVAKGLGKKQGLFRLWDQGRDIS